MFATPVVAPDDEHLAAIVARRGQSDGAMAAARDALDQLYRRHAPRLLAFLAARVRRRDLEDLHQDVWVRVWHHLPDGFHGGRFRAWLYRIARNALIDHARKKQAEGIEDAGSLPDRRQGSPDRCLLEHERAAILERCLEALDATTGAVVRARLGGEAYDEIALKLGVRPDRVYKIYHRAKADLKSCVERALG